MGAVKVNNEEIWNNYVKTGKVKGFSIEGYFADKMERPKESIEEKASFDWDKCDECEEVCDECKEEDKKERERLENGYILSWRY